MGKHTLSSPPRVHARTCYAFFHGRRHEFAGRSPGMEICASLPIKNEMETADLRSMIDMLIQHHLEHVKPRPSLQDEPTSRQITTEPVNSEQDSILCTPIFHGGGPFLRAHYVEGESPPGSRVHYAEGGSPCPPGHLMETSSSRSHLSHWASSERNISVLEILRLAENNSSCGSGCSQEDSLAEMSGSFKQLTAKSSTTEGVSILDLLSTRHPDGRTRMWMDSQCENVRTRMSRDSPATSEVGHRCPYILAVWCIRIA